VTGLSIIRITSGLPTMRPEPPGATSAHNAVLLPRGSDTSAKSIYPWYRFSVTAVQIRCYVLHNLGRWIECSAWLYVTILSRYDMPQIS
jgi:hypothetical protein